MSGVQRRLSAAGFRLDSATLLDRSVPLGYQSRFRWRWLATRLHTFVFVIDVPAPRPDEVEALRAAAQTYAVKHKPGLPAGFQSGSLSVPVFCTADVTDDMRGYFESRPPLDFAALQLPVLLDTSSGRVAYFRGPWRFGFVYAGYLRELAETVIAPR